MISSRRENSSDAFLKSTLCNIRMVTQLTLWCHLLVLLPDRKGLSRLWVPLFGMVSPLTSVLCCRTFLVIFINSSGLSSLTDPGLGAPLNSYLEGAIYKFNR